MNENTTNATGENKMELLLFQMGPVQEFIAQAATPSDLWAGSYLLSSLILAGIKSIPDYKNALIFPNLRDGSVLDAMEQNDVPTIPNRFLAEVEQGKGAEIAESVKKAVRDELNRLGKDLPAGAQTQLDQFLQMTWAVLDKPTGDMGGDYAAIGKLLAMRRNVRQFESWREDPAICVDGHNGPKDFLSGKETALDKDGRGAMNRLKLKLAMDKGKNDISTHIQGDSYLAIIAMDGDKMGATLSSLATREDHLEFSKRLAAFAMDAKCWIPTSGTLLYAGGDDVLAISPAKEAVNVAQSLAESFRKTMEGFFWIDEDKSKHPVSASVGIAIGHEKSPLLDVVQAAQGAEHNAKHLYGRNALALTVLKRSGETLTWGCNWDSPALALHKEIAGTLQNDLSASFPYKLAAFLEPYSLDENASDEMQEVVLRELENVWSRSSSKSTPVHEAALAYLAETFKKKRPQDFLNLFLCETFINRQRKED